MFFKILQVLALALLLVSCATKRRVLKELDRESPHHGHLFKLDSTVIEVVEIPEHRLKFYFYSLDEKSDFIPMSPKNVELKNGVIDPHETKQNFSILFIERQTYVEGIIERFEISPEDEHDIIVDIKIGERKRRIKIPFNHQGS